jgi:hypothetical protein
MNNANTLHLRWRPNGLGERPDDNWNRYD